jgi:hypothetical protein
MALFVRDCTAGRDGFPCGAWESEQYGRAIEVNDINDETARRIP